MTKQGMCFGLDHFRAKVQNAVMMTDSILSGVRTFYFLMRSSGLLMRGNWIACLAFLSTLSIAFAAHGPHVVFLSGHAESEWNEGDYERGARLLANSLEAAQMGFSTTVLEELPDCVSFFEETNVLVVYRGRDKFDDEWLDKLKDAESWYKGKGLVFLYGGLAFLQSAQWSLADDLDGQSQLDLEIVQREKMLWEPESLVSHPVLSGVQALELEDQWLDGIMPTSERAQVVPLVSIRDRSGTEGPHIVAWCAQNGESTRVFAYTGGFFHQNWGEDAVRRLVLNAIVWSSGLEIPEKGIVTDAPAIPQYRSIEEAIARGDIVDMIRHIESDPPSINREGRGNLTPLQLALMRNNVEAVRELLERGADTSVLTRASESVLHLALSRGSLETFELLLDHPVDLSVRDRIGWTVWHHAAARNQVKFVKSLAQRGHRPDTLSGMGGTALHEAAVSSGEVLIELLLELGVDPSVVSKDGRTALDIAKEYDNEVAIGVLTSLQE